MARVTVEDCISQIPNRFELVVLAARRSRRLCRGAEPTLPWENDKPTVMALREIAENTLFPEAFSLKEKTLEEEVFGATEAEEAEAEAEAEDEISEGDATTVATEEASSKEEAY